jgi:hemerythrin-like domain-containing protein
VKGMQENDAPAVAEHLKAYGELLAGHIKKEDEILYPWMDRQLTTTQIGELFSRFAAVNDTAGAGFTDHYAALVARAEMAVRSRESRETCTDQEKAEATL